MNTFDEYKIRYRSNGLLFNSEIEEIIIEYASKNDLMLSDEFRRSHYRFFQQNTPLGVEYTFLFQARKKTKDEVLRGQIEFHIQQLQE